MPFFCDFLQNFHFFSKMFFFQFFFEKFIPLYFLEAEGRFSCWVKTGENDRLKKKKMDEKKKVTTTDDDDDRRSTFFVPPYQDLAEFQKNHSFNDSEDQFWNVIKIVFWTKSCQIMPKNTESIWCDFLN